MVLFFGVLIFVHEFGHFITARMCKIGVKEFAVGMGPRLIKWRSKKYDTQYALRLLPIGGFVSMVGEDEESDAENAFCNKRIPQRMLVVIAGALMNLLLGFLLMTILVFSQGPLASNRIAKFEDNALSAEKLCVGDEIVKIGNTGIHTGDELVYEIMNQGYEPVDITVKRNGEKIKIEDVSFGTFTESGAVFGDYDFQVYQEQRNFGTIMKFSFYKSVSTVKMVYDSIIGLFSGRYGIEAVSGPVGAVEIVGTAAKLGVHSLLYMVAVFSINLGVFNMIPFPALDGGRFLFLVIEGIRRKPVNRNVEAYINFVGIMILFAFMIFITCKDVLKLIFR